MRILIIGWIFTFASSLVMYVVSILVARRFGAAAYGDYALAVASITLFGTAATLGLGRSGLNLLRLYRERAQWDLYFGYIRFSLIFTLLSSILLVLALLLAFLIYGKHFDGIKHVPRLHIYFIPLAAMVYFIVQVLIARNRLILAISILRIQFPLQVLILLIIFLMLIPDITVKYAVIAFGLSCLLCFISSIVVLILTHPGSIFTIKPQYKAVYWLSLAYPYFINATVLLALPYIPLIFLKTLHYCIRFDSIEAERSLLPTGGIQRLSPPRLGRDEPHTAQPL